ncbi:hypothetical protein IFR05_001380 [Cadophora sp. M221]|nr:hypothetical protein IFR05_001380 [Cadophora sp. M221]
MAVGFPLQAQTNMMAMMLAGQGNSALAIRNTGVRQTQCSTCQPDMSTGDHICDCQRLEAYISQAYGGFGVSIQDILPVAAQCDCPICPYAQYFVGAGNFLNGGLPIGGVSPFATAFGMGGGTPLNAALPMGGGLQINALALQGASPFGAASLGGLAGLSGLSGLGGHSGGIGGLSGGMMANGFGANNSRMFGFPMGGGVNRRGFGRVPVGKLGYRSRGGSF